MRRGNPAFSANDEREDAGGKEILGAKICEIEKIGTGRNSEIRRKFEILHGGEFETCRSSQTAADRKITAVKLVIRHDIPEIDLRKQVQSPPEVTGKLTQRKRIMGNNSEIKSKRGK